MIVSDQNTKFSLSLVNDSINQICDQLQLSAFVRTGCIELCSRVMSGHASEITKPIGNAVACAIVSIVHEESKRKGRVSKHLPDRIVGNVFGLSSVSVVYNKRLINTAIGGNSSKLAHIR